MAWRSYDYQPMFSRRGGHDYVYRPLLEVELAAGENKGIFGALVDLGTDATMMDAEVAAFLGIDLQKAQLVKASGIGEESYKGYIEKVTLSVPGFDEKIVSDVIFVEKLGFDIVLGQQDFFHRFLVKFEQHKKKFYLKPSPTEDEK